MGVESRVRNFDLGERVREGFLEEVMFRFRFNR